eukprot:11083511-Alexandrium_andersonii.AAC.1
MRLLAGSPGTPIIPSGRAPCFSKVMLARSLVVCESDDKCSPRPGHTIGGPPQAPATHQEVPTGQGAPASLTDSPVVRSQAKG